MTELPRQSSAALWPPEPHPDSDARNYDAVRDDLAVPDPYETEWEPPHRHGLVKPPEDVAATLAATPASAIAHTAGRPDPADAGPAFPSSREAGPARGTPESTSAPASHGGSA